MQLLQNSKSSRRKHDILVFSVKKKKKVFKQKLLKAVNQTLWLNPPGSQVLYDIPEAALSQCILLESKK